MDIVTLALAKKYADSVVADPEGKIDEKIAMEIAKVVGGASADFDTLKEIADWIMNDTTGAAAMANDIKNLKSNKQDVLIDKKNIKTINGNSILGAGDLLIKVIQDHNELSGKDKTNQHPISAITGLTEKLQKGLYLGESQDINVNF